MVMKHFFLFNTLIFLIFSSIFGQIEVKSYHLDAIDEQYFSSQDDNMERYLKQLKRKMDQQMEIEVGYSDRELSNDIPNELPYLLTRLLCEHVQSFSVMHDLDSVDIALLNYGGIRASLPQGILTVGDFYRILPFENLIVLLDIKGSELQKIAEIERKRDVAAFYGLQILENNQKITINGKFLVPEETYRIVTVDFIASGGDNILKDIEFKQVVNTMQLLRDGILEEVKKMSAHGEHIK